MLITLEKYKERIFDPAKQILADLKPADGLFLSAIGARICYSSDHPLDLLTDKRVSVIEERISFLRRLAKAKHYSVFAHSPVFADIHWADIELIDRLYKAWIFPGEKACLNARHLVEATKSIDERWVENAADIKIFIYDLQSSNRWKEYDFSTRPDKCLICFYIDQEPWRWLSVIIHGVSTIMTHQLVRHTWLNFCQRSHRYTEVDGFVIPKSAYISDVKINSGVVPANLVYEEQYNQSLLAYSILVESGIPKEDARFVTASGRKTTIIASGPYFVWEDFVSKRVHSKAQWEIREIACAIKNLLDELK